MLMLLMMLWFRCVDIDVWIGVVCICRNGL